jgi:hypothetical protein
MGQRRVYHGSSNRGYGNYIYNIHMEPDLYQWAYRVGLWQKLVEFGIMLSGAAASWAAWEANRARRQTQAAMVSQAKDNERLVESSLRSSKAATESAHAAQATLEIAKEELRLEQIPWLTVTGFRSFAAQFSTYPEDFYVHVRNGGRSPAMECDINAIMTVVDSSGDVRSVIEHEWSSHRNYWP